MVEFSDLHLSKALIQALEESGIEEPKEIQEKAIPVILKGRDLIGKSSTGSGKTLAFAAGIIERVVIGAGVQALVLTPTRELAEQVTQAFISFSKYKKLNVIGIYGGVDKVNQYEDLREVEVVVGTPGRILEHIGRKTLKLDKLKTIVLDEADKMLNMGFIKEVETVLNACPRKRQTILFSATISKEINLIARKYMSEPEEILIEDQVDPSRLYQVYYDVPKDMKFSLLVHLLRKAKNGISIVFCNTRVMVEILSRNLYRNGIMARVIHGGLEQEKRMANMKEFKVGDTKILVCTDLAARGLHIENVTHVYNFDFPKLSTDYVHRIGRTARSGKNGTAISFVSEGDHGELRQICKEASLKIEKLPVPKIEKIPSELYQSYGPKNMRRKRRRF